MITELQNRGVRDILIACVDGLKGFPDALESVYPGPEFSSVSSTWCATPCGSYPTSTVNNWQRP